MRHMPRASSFSLISAGFSMRDYAAAARRAGDVRWAAKMMLLRYSDNFSMRYGRRLCARFLIGRGRAWGRRCAARSARCVIGPATRRRRMAPLRGQLTGFEASSIAAAGYFSGHRCLMVSARHAAERAICDARRPASYRRAFSPQRLQTLCDAHRLPLITLFRFRLFSARCADDVAEHCRSLGRIRLRRSRHRHGVTRILAGDDAGCAGASLR